MASHGARLKMLAISLGLQPAALIPLIADNQEAENSLDALQKFLTTEDTKTLGGAPKKNIFHRVDSNGQEKSYESDMRPKEFVKTMLDMFKTLGVQIGKDVEITHEPGKIIFTSKSAKCDEAFNKLFEKLGMQAAPQEAKKLSPDASPKEYEPSAGRIPRPYETKLTRTR